MLIRFCEKSETDCVYWLNNVLEKLLMTGAFLTAYWDRHTGKSAAV